MGVARLFAAGVHSTFASNGDDLFSPSPSFPPGLSSPQDNIRVMVIGG